MRNKDSIVISDLSRAETLLLPSRIKSIIRAYEQSKDLTEDSVITNWVELFGLSRLVIVFSSPEATQDIYTTLKADLSDCANISINLNETLVRKHKSQENLKEPTSPLPALNETGLYREPTPFSKPTRSNSIDLMDLNIPNHDSKVTTNQTLTLLKPLEIPKELSPIRTSFKDNEKEPSPMSPTITFERVDI